MMDRPRTYSIWADVGFAICFDDPDCPRGMAALDYTGNFLDDQPGAVPEGEENPRVCLASDVESLLAAILSAAREVERAAYSAQDWQGTLVEDTLDDLFALLGETRPLLPCAPPSRTQAIAESLQGSLHSAAIDAVLSSKEKK